MDADKGRGTIPGTSGQTKGELPQCHGSVFQAGDLGDWYHPVILGAETVGSLSVDSRCLPEIISILERLEIDDYVRYLLAYYAEGLSRFGDAWKYSDIVTVLFTSARLFRPQSYLEIGVRRGRSMAMVAAVCPQCKIVGFDMWTPNYAGMPNPGADFVRAEMKKLGYEGELELIGGNSHETLPRYLEANPDAFFDLVTVDGDHSDSGARQDIRDVLPRIKVGGGLVFDDICHPSHPYLLAVWQEMICSNPDFSTWEFTDLGYGVAVAVRKC